VAVGLVNAYVEQCGYFVLIERHKALDVFVAETQFK
jgi:hypothetical protein